MPRFFVEEPPKAYCFVDGENGRHMVRSLRIRPGEEVTLCDGAGKDYLCVVERLEEEGAWVLVKEVRESVCEPRVKAVICQCFPKGDKLETVVQKSVELGAQEIWPVQSERCIVKLDQKSGEKRTARLQKIALEAAKQSGRGRVPKVRSLLSLKEALRQAKEKGEILFFYEKGTASLKEALRETGDRVFLFIGPEGGFSPEEAEFAESLGAKLLSLGPRILRTETAPLAALSALLYEKGEMELPTGWKEENPL